MSDTPPPPESPPSVPPPSDPRVIEAKHDGRIWTTDQVDAPAIRDDGAPLRRSFASKLFGVGVWGWLRLAGLCMVVGAIMRIGNVNPLAPDFTLRGAATSLASGLGNLAVWLVGNGWLPALMGGLVVLPLWLVWRLLSSPFRR